MLRKTEDDQGMQKTITPRSGSRLDAQGALERPDALIELVEDDAHDLQGLVQVGHGLLPRVAAGGALGELVECVAMTHFGTMRH
jgi:hypothetical protein